MSNVKIEIIDEGLQELLRNGFNDILEQGAQQQIAKHGGGKSYYTERSVGRTRAEVTVRTNDWETYGHNKKHNPKWGT